MTLCEGPTRSYSSKDSIHRRRLTMSDGWGKEGGMDAFRLVQGEEQRCPASTTRQDHSLWPPAMTQSPVSLPFHLCGLWFPHLPSLLAQLKTSCTCTNPSRATGPQSTQSHRSGFQSLLTETWKKVKMTSLHGGLDACPGPVSWYQGCGKQCHVMCRE